MSGEPASSGHGPLEEPAIIPHPTRVGVWLIPDTEQGRAVIAQVPPARQPWPAERAHARILGSNALGILAGYTVFMAALAVMDHLGIERAVLVGVCFSAWLALATAALAGWLLLGQQLAWLELVGIALVITASIGAVRSSNRAAARSAPLA